jgi:hypothetical protein
MADRDGGRDLMIAGRATFLAARKSTTTPIGRSRVFSCGRDAFKARHFAAMVYARFGVRFRSDTGLLSAGLL